MKKNKNIKKNIFSNLNLWTLLFVFVLFFLFLIPGKAVALECCVVPGDGDLCLSSAGCPRNYTCCGTGNRHFSCTYYCSWGRCRVKEALVSDCDNQDGYTCFAENEICYMDHSCTAEGCIITADSPSRCRDCDDGDACSGIHQCRRRDYNCQGGDTGVLSACLKML